MSDTMPNTNDTTPIVSMRLTRDLRDAALTLTDDEARFLVDGYYLMQEQRKRSDNQVRAMGEEPHQVVEWLAKQSHTLENQVKSALTKYVSGHDMWPWFESVKGIGPILSAGLLAHIDMEKCPTVGHIWAFGGYDPTREWGKGEKRPWNASLKTLFWKCGESFVKVSGDEEATYGQIYKQRKELEIARNEAGKFAAQAAATLKKKKFSKTTDAYKAYISGKLPPAHIHARAKRYAVKLFLAHMHEHWHQIHFDRPAPAPYPIAHIPGHTHKI